MEDDPSLLRRYAKTHDEAAFTELVRRYLDAVYSSALRRLGGDAHLAQDAAQQVFVELARHAHRVAEHPILAAWLHTATRNVAANLVRTETRRRARENEVMMMNPLFDENEDHAAADWGRVAPLLDWAIDQLNEADRGMLLLRFVARKSFSEIGASNQSSENAARMRVDRALEKLRRILRRRGIVSTATALNAALTTHAVVAAPANLAASAVTASLAAVPASLGPITLCIQIMTTSKMAAGAAAGFLFAAAASVATYQWNQLTRTEAALVAVRNETAEISSQLVHLQTRIQTANTLLQERRKVAAKLTLKTPAASSSSPAENTNASDPQAVGNAFLKRHPEVRQALAEYLKSREDETYGPLFARLQFPPEKLDRLRSLLREHMWFGRPLGETGEYANFGLSTGKSYQDISKEMYALLGREGMKLFGELSALQSPRHFVATAAADLTFTDEPMNPKQADELLAAIKANTKFGSNRTPEIDWPALEADAAAVLLPAQISVLSHLRLIDEWNALAMKLPKPKAEVPKTASSPGSS